MGPRAALGQTDLTVGEINWLGDGPPESGQRVQVKIRSTSDQLQLSFARDEQQRVVVVPTNVEHGETSLQIGKSDLQTLLLDGAREAAKDHGADVDDATLSLEQSSDNAARFSTTFQARKGMFSATIKILGRIEVDEHLTLRINDLDCHGESSL